MVSLTTAKPEALWDDDDFRQWVREGARSQGLTLTEALREAGVSRLYLRRQPKPTVGRSTNVVMQLSRILDRSPAKLLGLPDTAPVEELRDALKLWCQHRGHKPDLVAEGEEDTLLIEAKEARARIVSEMFAAQLIALVAQHHDDAMTLINKLLRGAAENLRNGIEPDPEHDRDHLAAAASD